MFIVEGGLSFDTRQGVAGARAFQNELKKTSKIAVDAGRSGRDLESSFSRLGDQRTRSAIRGLAGSLANARDATEAAIDSARALQQVFIRSLGGTAVIGAATLISNQIRELAIAVKSSAQEAASARKGMDDLASSFGEGAKRAETLNSAADNISKTLSEIKSKRGIIGTIMGESSAEKEMRKQEQSLRNLARIQGEAGAAVGRQTAERRLGMTPEQVAEDKRIEEENKRIAEAEKISPQAAEDVRATIALENQKRLNEGLDAQKGAEKDLADYQQSLDKIKEQSARAIEQARLDGLAPAKRIIELGKKETEITKKLASLRAAGLAGTEVKRKKELAEQLELEKDLLSISEERLKASKEIAATEEEITNEAIKKEREQAVKRDEYARKERQRAEEKKREERVARQERIARVQQAALGGGGILGASRTGRQEFSVAQRQRQREATIANFKTLEGGGATGFFGENKNPGLLQQVADQMNAEEKSRGGSRVFGKRDARKRIAQQQAAMQNPFLSEQLTAAGTGGSAEDLARFGAQQKQGAGSQDLIQVLDRLVSAMESAPYVTSGSGR